MGEFDLTNWGNNTLKSNVVPLLKGGEKDWPGFAICFKSALMKQPKLREVIARNPDSALLSVVKCARLGLSLNPVDEHFALIPYGSEVQGQVMTRGWMYLAQSSGRLESIECEVIYKQEYDPRVPLRDQATGMINHVPQFLERDQWKDDDIVGAYAWAKVQGNPRPVVAILSRGEIEKRRAKGMGNTPAWKEWFIQMCKVKATKALLRSGQVPLTPVAKEAVFAKDADEDEVVKPAQATVRVAPAATPASKLPDSYDAGQVTAFEEIDKNPLPTDEEAREIAQKSLLAYLKGEKIPRKLYDMTVNEVCGDIAEPTDLSKEHCEQVLAKLRSTP